MQFISYHNHSNFSDGDNDMADMVLAARERGLSVFGMSDHYVPFPDGTPVDWSMDLSRLDEYVQAVLDCRRRFQTDNFRVLLGLEVDFFPENATEIAAFLRQRPVDYLIGSAHFAGTFPIDHSKELWDDLGSQEAVDDVFHQYWHKILLLCQSNLYDIIGHLDLPKKFGYAPSYDQRPEIEAVLQAIRATGKKLELNTAGYAKLCREAYPAPWIVARARELGITVIPSSDAHAPSQIGQFYDQARAQLD